MASRSFSDFLAQQEDKATPERLAEMMVARDYFRNLYKDVFAKIETLNDSSEENGAKE